MANSIRQNARTITVTFNGECDHWTASVTVARPARGADATRTHFVNLDELGPWLKAYAACLSATTND